VCQPCGCAILQLSDLTRRFEVDVALMTENPLPSSLYEGLLEKLVIVLELAQKQEGVDTPSAKQAILQAVRLLYAYMCCHPLNPH
jgi:hypothetical protein